MLIKNLGLSSSDFSKYSWLSRNYLVAQNTWWSHVSLKWLDHTTSSSRRLSIEETGSTFYEHLIYYATLVYINFGRIRVWGNKIAIHMFSTFSVVSDLFLVSSFAFLLSLLLSVNFDFWGLIGGIRLNSVCNVGGFSFSLLPLIGVMLMVVAISKMARAIFRARPKKKAFTSSLNFLPTVTVVIAGTFLLLWSLFPLDVAVSVSWIITMIHEFFICSLAVLILGLCYFYAAILIFIPFLLTHHLLGMVLTPHERSGFYCWYLCPFCIRAYLALVILSLFVRIYCDLSHSFFFTAVIQSAFCESGGLCSTLSELLHEFTESCDAYHETQNPSQAVGARLKLTKLALCEFIADYFLAAHKLTSINEHADFVNQLRKHLFTMDRKSERVAWRVGQALDMRFERLDNVCLTAILRNKAYVDFFFSNPTVFPDFDTRLCDDDTQHVLSTLPYSAFVSVTAKTLGFEASMPKTLPLLGAFEVWQSDSASSFFGRLFKESPVIAASSLNSVIYSPVTPFLDMLSSGLSLPIVESSFDGFEIVPINVTTDFFQVHVNAFAPNSAGFLLSPAISLGHHPFFLDSSLINTPQLITEVADPISSGQSFETHPARSLWSQIVKQQPGQLFYGHNNLIRPPLVVVCSDPASDVSLGGVTHVWPAEARVNSSEFDSKVKSCLDKIAASPKDYGYFKNFLYNTGIVHYPICAVDQNNYLDVEVSKAIVAGLKKAA